MSAGRPKQSWYSEYSRISKAKYLYAKLKALRENKLDKKFFENKFNALEEQALIKSTFTPKDHEIFALIDKMHDVTYEEFLNIQNGTLTFTNGSPELNPKVSYGNIQKIHLHIEMFIRELQNNKYIQENFDQCLANILELQKFFFQLKSDHSLAIEIARKNLLKHTSTTTLSKYDEAVKNESWLSLSPEDIETAKKEFDKFSDILKGGSGKKSKYAKKLEYAKEIFEHIDSFKKISIKDFIKRDKEGKIAYEVTRQPSLHKDVDDQLITSLTAGIESFLDDVKKSKKIKKNLKEALPLLLSLRHFVLRVKSDHNCARLVAERIILTEDRQAGSKLPSQSSKVDLTATIPTTPTTPSVSRTPSPPSSISSSSSDPLSASSSSIDASRSESMKAELDALKRELETTKERNEKLSAELENSQKKLTDTERQAEELKQQLNLNEALKEKAAKLADEKAKLERDLAQENKKRKELEDANRQHVSTTQSDKAATSKEVTELKRKLEAAEKKNEELKKTSAELAALKQEQAKLVAENQSRIQGTQQSAEQVKKLSEQVKAEIDARTELSSRITSVNTENDRLRDEIKTKNAELVSLRLLVQDYRGLPEPVSAPKKTPWWVYGLAGLGVAVGLGLALTGVGAVLGIAILAKISMTFAIGCIGGGALTAVVAVGGCAAGAYRDGRAQNQFENTLDLQRFAVLTLNNQSIEPSSTSRKASKPIEMRRLSSTGGSGPRLFAKGAASSPPAADAAVLPLLRKNSK